MEVVDGDLDGVRQDLAPGNVNCELFDVALNYLCRGAKDRSENSFEGKLLHLDVFFFDSTVPVVDLNIVRSEVLTTTIMNAFNLMIYWTGDHLLR